MYGVNDNMYLKATYNLNKEITKQRNDNLLFGHKLLVNKRRLKVFLQKNWQNTCFMNQINVP